MNYPTDTIYATNSHKISGNTIVDDSAGIHLRQATGNVFTGNTITAPRPLVIETAGNTFTGNTCNGNPCP